MSATRDRIKIQKLEEKLTKCVQYLIVLAAETGRVDAYDLLEKVEGKRTSYTVMNARAKPFFDAQQKSRDAALERAIQTKKKNE